MCLEMCLLKKKQIMSRLLGIQETLATRPNSFLLNLQEQISEE